MLILLADDQKEVRLGLKILLENQLEPVEIDEAHDLSSLIIKSKEKNPDIILLDWELAYSRISDIIPALKYLCPKIRIIAMSSHPEALNAALNAGCDSFVSKGEQPEKLLEAIKGLVR